MLEVVFKDLQYALAYPVPNSWFQRHRGALFSLGIGANPAIFTLIDAVMLRSLPVRAPGELVSVGDASRPTARWNGETVPNIFSYPLYQRLRDQNHVFKALFASGQTGHIDVSVANGAPDEGRGRLVSGNYFQVLGVSPVLGRTFSPDEERTPGATPVVVIGYDYWVNRFARPQCAGNRAQNQWVPLYSDRRWSASFLGRGSRQPCRYLDSPFNAGAGQSRRPQARQARYELAAVHGAAQAWHIYPAGARGDDDACTKRLDRL